MSRARREPGGHHHARSDCLAVQPGTEARGGLDGMAERVPEVEERPHTGLALVLRDDGRLELARTPDGVGEGPPVAGQELFDVLLETTQEGGAEQKREKLLARSEEPTSAVQSR